MNFKSKQQLAVIAHYSDGSTRDVTRLASYEANHSEMAISNAMGRITIEDLPGEVAIMVRFQGSVGVFRAIVDPEDDMRVTNPPSNPELLDALTKHFQDHRFDLKDLVRTICKSNAYQLSSQPTEFNRTDLQKRIYHSRCIC